jgi:hypothetical protein
VPEQDEHKSEEDAAKTSETGQKNNFIANLELLLA